ncbi:MAG TPA: tail protein X [Longimicrobiales bacterium]
MFFDGSRYLDVGDYTVTGPDGREVKVKRARALTDATGTFTYRVKEGDRLDLLAYRFYRTPRKWWLICDANPGLMYPDDLLRTGQVLVIPRDRTA